MKAIAETKFDRLIKEGFQQILKPLGFKKKVNNFYLQLRDLGQIINIQKSTFYSKEHIQFTINTGLFIPEYWLTYFTFHNGELPAYPTESQCAIRQRIGSMKYKHDKWFDIEADTNEEVLIEEMKDNLLNYILPYFEKTNAKAGVLQLLDDRLVKTENTFGRLIIYGEYKQFEKAQAEYNKLQNEKYTVAHFKSSLDKYKAKYGLQN